MGAAALLFNKSGEILIVKPTYKEFWALPGGGIEPFESPTEAIAREIREELGIELAPTHLLCIDYQRKGNAENLQFLFDGGDLDKSASTRVRLLRKELSAFRFAPHKEAIQLLSPLLGARLPYALSAKCSGGCIFLEEGRTPLGRSHETDNESRSYH